METLGSSETSVHLRVLTSQNMVPAVRMTSIIYRNVRETENVTTEMYRGMEAKRCKLVVDGWTVSPCRFTSRERKAD